MPDIVVSVKHVSKNFRLPQERTGTVKAGFTRMLHHRNKRIETQHAVKDVSFEVSKGEFFGIVGRNGSGKSTLLKMLAGIYQPTQGSVSVKGKLVPFIELGVGFNPELTGRQNVYLNGAMLGFSEKEIDGQYSDIVNFAELEEFMDQKLKNYSSGMQVRLAFSMAVRAKADVLLIDEVLAVGDADFQRKCFEYFKKLKKEKITVIFVTHDMSAVREYCDRAMLIENNKLALLGDTDKVAQAYTKLFNVIENNKGSTDSESSRWGDGAVVVSSVESSVSDESIKLKVAIQANKDFSGLVIGVRVRSSTGKEVTGTNTKKEKVQIPEITKGEKKLITISMPNIFSDGKYSIDIALQHADGITVSDWWDDATMLDIKKKRRLPYDIDPGFIIEVS